MSAVMMFQDFQCIYGFCPCCGESFRLSEATLHYKSMPPTTPWDVLDAGWERLEAAQERFTDQQYLIREESREAGRKEADRRLKTLTAAFRRSGIHIGDVRLMFDPVDYVIFHGMRSDRCKEIEFLDREPTSRPKEQLQRSIEHALRAGNVWWTTARIGDDGHIVCT